MDNNAERHEHIGVGNKLVGMCLPCVGPSVESIHDRVLSLIMLPYFEVAIVLEAKWQRQ